MRIKINTTWEEDEAERREFFAGLSYSERLKNFIKARKKWGLYESHLITHDLRICDSIQLVPYK